MVWWKKAKATESNTGTEDVRDAEEASQDPEAPTQDVADQAEGSAESAEDSAESVQAEDDGGSAEADDSSEIENTESVEIDEDSAELVEAEDSENIVDDSAESVEAEESVDADATAEVEDSAEIDDTAEIEDADSAEIEEIAQSEETDDAADSAEFEETAEVEDIDVDEVEDSAESEEIAESEETEEVAESEETEEIVESEEIVGAPVEDSAEAESVTVDTDETADQGVLIEDADGSGAPDFTAPDGSSLTGSDTLVSPVSGTADMPIIPAKKPMGQGFRNTILTVVGSVLGAILLVVGCGAVGTSYFDSHAKPGAELAGRDITGFSMTQVRNVAATIIENYTASLELDGKQANATAKNLGVTFDLDKTVGEAMNAGSTATVSDRYNPFNTKKTLLVMSVDEDKLQDYLNATFISDDQRSVPAGVVYDDTQGGFVVQPGKDGTEADAAKVAQELKAGKGIGEALTVATTSEPPRITDATAQQTADAANQLLAAPYKVTAGTKDYTIPADSIASWVTFTSDQDAGTIQMSIDTDKAAADLPGMLADNLSTPVIPQQNLYSPDGRYLGVQNSGSTGTDVADPDGVAAEVIQALVAGSGMDATVDTKVTPFPEDQVTIGDGVKWVEVNRSNFTVTRWEGGNALSTWTVVIGKPSTPTYAGIFHVWAKVRLQDMKGPGYVQPDVPYSAYFNDDIALHGNYWVGSFGWASSHGCVGMPVAQAEIMFNWIEIGTLVVVHD